MKLVLMFWATLFTGILNAIAQQTNPLPYVTKLLVVTESKMKRQGVDFPEGVTENVTMLRNISEFASLENGADSFWEVGMDNLAEVAPSEIEKIIFVRACQRMEPVKYLTFLNKAADLYDTKIISRDLLTTVLYPDNQMRYVIQDNYRNKEVIAFCQRAKRIWADDPVMIQMFDATLSGEAKRGIDTMRANGGTKLPDTSIVVPSAERHTSRRETLIGPGDTPPLMSAMTTKSAPALSPRQEVVNQRSKLALWFVTLIGIVAAVIAIAQSSRRRRRLPKSCK